MDTYILNIILNDSHDEFSSSFNPKIEEHVEDFEQEIRNLLEVSWSVKDVKLVKVETVL